MMRYARTACHVSGRDGGTLGTGTARLLGDRLEDLGQEVRVRNPDRPIDAGSLVLLAVMGLHYHVVARPGP